MRIEEAKYIGELIKKYKSKEEVSLLNIGSSTEDFRKNIKPHIDAELFSPLKNLNIKITHFDLKDDDGVDISGDIFDSNTQIKLKLVRPSLILACNILEHLEKDMKDHFPKIMDEILEDDGIIIVTVPYSFPLHLDPIDTYYRPSPEELRLLFPHYDLLNEKIIVSTNYFSDFRAFSVFLKLRIIVRVFTPFYKPKNWLCAIHRFFWFFRPYLVSCVVLQKKGIE
jgi:hypothetical protein